MGAELCLLKNAALVVLSQKSDLIIAVAFLVAIRCGLRGTPVFIHLIACNVFYIITAIYEPEFYWLLCFISSSFVFQYYYSLQKITYIPALALCGLTITMGAGTLFEYLGIYGLYDSLFNRYEVCVTLIYIAILLSLIDWRRVQEYLGELINNVLTGQSSVNRLFSIL